MKGQEEEGNKRGREKRQGKGERRGEKVRKRKQQNMGPAGEEGE